jgi:regulator of sigma E protease
MLGFTRGPTRYRVSWVPLGGYVRMAGENEQPDGGYLPDDYPAQPVWKRSLIIVAGVAMNAILGFALFATAAVLGLTVTPPVVGAVASGSPAWEAGIRPGDRILSVNGERVVDFVDLQYASIRGDPLDLEVGRDGRTLRFSVTPRASVEGGMPAIGVSPDPGRSLAAPEGGDAWRLGLRPGDEVAAVEGFPCDLATLVYDPHLLSTLEPVAGPLHLTVRRGDATVPVALPPFGGPQRRIGIAPLQAEVEMVREGGAAAAAGWKAGDRPVSVGSAAVRGLRSFRSALLRAPPGPLAIGVRRGETTVDLPAPPEPAARLALLGDLHFALDPERPVVEVYEGTLPGPDGGTVPWPAQAAGIPTGARITRVQGAPVTKYGDVVARIVEVKAGPVKVAWEGPAGPGEAEILPYEFPVHDLRVLATSDDTEFVRASGLLEPLAFAQRRCVTTTRQIGSTVAGLFRGSVDKSNLGGPILIAQVAHQSSKQGFGRFLHLLAVLSLNLMLLNILPIPVLDGGALALLGVEAITRKPPSEAVVGISQMAGLALLLLLMVLVTFNDLARLFSRG